MSHKLLYEVVPVERLDLTLLDRQVLERWARAKATPQSIAVRSRMVLLTADGRTRRDVAARLGISAQTVTLWIRRFQQLGPDGLTHEASGRGRKSQITKEQIEALLRARAMPPSQASPSWTIRALASAHGISPATVHRILRKFPPSV